MLDVYKNTDQCNLGNEQKILIAFDDIIADINTNKKLQSIVTELLIKGREINIPPAFIKKSYFETPKYIKINCTQFFIIKIPDRKEFQ